jgi:hypothetical protein
MKIKPLWPSIEFPLKKHFERESFPLRYKKLSRDLLLSGNFVPRSTKICGIREISWKHSKERIGPIPIEVFQRKILRHVYLYFQHENPKYESNRKPLVPG